MAARDGSAEKRRHRRRTLSRPVRTRRADEDDIDAMLRDISVGGAAMKSDEDVDLDEALELDIEDVGQFSAEVARHLDDGFAVRFTDIDEEEEEQLLADLARLDESARDEY